VAPDRNGFALSFYISYYHGIGEIMPVKSVLIALEEQKKWKKRKEFLQTKLENVRRKKRAILEQLEFVNKQLTRFDKVMASLKETAIPPGVSAMRIESMR
jgi:hypothetical protein